jgi:hypothetical protein
MPATASSDARDASRPFGEPTPQPPRRRDQPKYKTTLPQATPECQAESGPNCTRTRERSHPSTAAAEAGPIFLSGFRVDTGNHLR